MKNRVLPLAAVAAMSCAMGTAHAVNVNNDGLGEVLLYPYYSASAGNDTYINVVNTTNAVKAVKVRFVEGMNSVEVLDFNLYLSPQDHWSGVITSSATGAILKTGDTSCTVPAIPAAGVPFSGTLFSGDSVNSLTRTREGYVEIIEMGVVTDVALAAAATHVAGTPADCAALTTAWSGGGQWAINPANGVVANEGGLYGYGVLINVNEGIDATYDAIALDAFSAAAVLHAAPGDSSPALNDADLTATVIDNATVTTTVTLSGLDAVSAVIMHDTIANDYVLEPTIAAGTDWVMTMPTKHDYVDAAPVQDPFTNLWDTTTSDACEQIGITYYDREEAGQTPAGVDFSPRPVAGSFALCAEANVLTFNNSNVLGAQDLGNLSTNLNVIYNNGWMKIAFDDAGAGIGGGATSRQLNGLTAGFDGLPVVGFAVQQYTNGTLTVGGVSVLSNYAGSVTHKTTRNVR